MTWLEQTTNVEKCYTCARTPKIRMDGKSHAMALTQKRQSGRKISRQDAKTQK
jgi:hypothetical protein